MTVEPDAQALTIKRLAETIDRLAKAELVGCGLQANPEKPRMIRANPSFGAQLRYVRYLAGKVPQYLRLRQFHRAQGKLQFAMGVLWSTGCVSVRTMREIEAQAIRRGHATHAH